MRASLNFIGSLVLFGLHVVYLGLTFACTVLLDTRNNSVAHVGLVQIFRVLLVGFFPGRVLQVFLVLTLICDELYDLY